MKNEIKKLYDLENGYVILPSDLVANAKLPNYEHVKFSSTLQGLVVECLCIADDGDKVLFMYYFDIEDKLQRMVMDDGIKSDIIFDRKAETDKLRNRLKKAAFEATLLKS